MNTENANMQYEVLNPWAEVDPKPLRGISPRLDSLIGKKIGLYRNGKPATHFILPVLERKLKELFPTIEICYFGPTAYFNIEQDQEYQDWLKGVDGVITGVGD